MNLYIFNETRRGSVYGVGTYIRELSNSLKSTDIKICVVNLVSDKPQILIEEKEGIQYLYFPSAIQEQRSSDEQKQWDNYFCNVVYLLKVHIVDKNDLIFHLNFHQNETLVEELKKAFTCRVISVAHFSDWGFTVFDDLKRLRHIINNEEEDSFSKNVKKSFIKEKSYYSKVDHSICLSNYMYEILCNDYKLDPNKVSVIPNGLTNINNNPFNCKLLRKKWNINPREKIILFVGRIDEVKGVYFLIKAFHEVLKTETNSRLIIAGSGDFDLYFKEAKVSCTKITFTGLLNRNELNELYHIANIGVVPSLFEPFGYVPIEMMMHGLPIIATATSGLNEVVDDTCGIKINLTKLTDRIEIDTLLLAQKISYLIQRPLEAKKLGRNGRKRYLEKYSSEIFRQNMINLYSSL